MKQNMFLLTVLGFVVLGLGACAEVKQEAADLQAFAVRIDAAAQKIEAAVDTGATELAQLVADDLPMACHLAATGATVGQLLLSSHAVPDGPRAQAWITGANTVAAGPACSLSGSSQAVKVDKLVLASQLAQTFLQVKSAIGKTNAELANR